jgi:hypothetical protein
MVDTSEPATIPAMPLEWRQYEVRAMSPARFGMKVRLEMFTQGRDLKPGLTVSSGGKFEHFPATPAGWVDAWTLAAKVAGPAAFAKGLTSWSRRTYGYLGATRDAAAIAELDARIPPLLYAVMFVGGHGCGEQLSPGALVDLRLDSAGIALTASSDGTILMTISAAELTGAEASDLGGSAGPFVATTGHGIGDLWQADLVGWLNNLGPRKDRTLVRIQSAASEVFLTSKSYSPQNAQIALSGIRVLAQAQPGKAASQPGSDRPHEPVVAPVPPVAVPAAPASLAPVPDEADLVAKLERLAKLYESGALTLFEFQAAKDKLLR